MNGAKRLISLLLCVVLILSAAPQLAFAIDGADPVIELGTYSGDMLAGGGKQVLTDVGLFYVGAEDGFIYNTEKGTVPVFAEPSACLNYADGILCFARLREGCFDVCTLDLQTQELTVLLQAFGGTPAQLYLVNRETVYFLSDRTIWSLTLEDQTLNYVRFVDGMRSFVPTGCGMIYAVGELFDYTLYAEDQLLAEHVDSYSVDFDLGSGTLIYSSAGADYQMDLAEAFSAAPEAAAYEGYGEVEAESLFTADSDVTLRNLMQSATQLLLQSKQAEETQALAIDADIQDQLQALGLDDPDAAHVLEIPEEAEDPAQEEAEDPAAPAEEAAEPETAPEPEAVPEPAAEPEPIPEAPETEPEPLPQPEPEPAEIPETEPVEEPAAEPVETDPEHEAEAPEEIPEAPAGEEDAEPASEADQFAWEDLYPDTCLDYEIVQIPEQEEDPDAELLASAKRRPASEGTMNILRRAAQMTDIKWRPRKDVTAWGGSMTYKAGVTYTGLPYGQAVNACYVPWSATLTEFIAAVNNVGSKMYTDKSTFYKVAPYYSTDCSGFVSWAWDLPYRQTTGTITKYGTMVSNSSYADIQVGDCMNSSGHVVLISDVTYDMMGTITSIEVSESTPVVSTNCCCRRVRFSGDGLVAFRNKYFGNGYTIYRSKTRDSATYTHECVVPVEGDECAVCGIGMFLKPGIDVSEHQGVIDWEMVKPYINFAIIRVADGAERHPDTQFDRNVKECERLGIPYGVYIYTRAVNAEQAMQEADYVLGRIMNYRPQLPIFFDVEEPTGILASNMTNAQILSTVSAFCETIENCGFRAGVYSSTYPWNDRLNDSKYNNWCRWVAQWSQYCTAKAGAHLWQFTAGTLPGISTTVDMNYWYGTAGSEDHRYQANMVAPTCTTAGTLNYTCVECGKTVSKKLTPTGHHFADGKCTICGKVQTVVDTMLDVSENDWYASAVEYVVNKKLFNGTSAVTFEPETPMSRAMMVTVLWRLAGSPSEAQVARFHDVGANMYYAEAVNWAANHGIVQGEGDGIFNPDSNVSREQVATFLYRYAKYAGYNVGGAADLTVFPDNDEVSIYAWQPLSWAVSKGLIKGSEEAGKTLLLPDGYATRAQVATIFMRFSQELERKKTSGS